MIGTQWLIEAALIVLLTTTLFHAVRLERALGVLKRDRATLEQLVAGFNASTRQAESGIERLHAAADGAGRQVARATEQAEALKCDLVFLIERGDAIADRLDRTVRAARGRVEVLDAGAPRPPREMADVDPDSSRPQSEAERELRKALRLAR